MANQNVEQPRKMGRLVFSLFFYSSSQRWTSSPESLKSKFVVAECKKVPHIAPLNVNFGLLVRWYKISLDHLWDRSHFYLPKLSRRLWELAQVFCYIIYLTSLVIRNWVESDSFASSMTHLNNFIWNECLALGNINVCRSEVKGLFGVKILFNLLEALYIWISYKHGTRRCHPNHGNRNVNAFISSKRKVLNPSPFCLRKSWTVNLNWSTWLTCLCFGMTAKDASIVSEHMRRILNPGLHG